MLSPVIRKRGTDRLVYTVSPWFRLVFFAIALVVVLSIASVPEGTFFSRLNVFSVVFFAVCLLAGLYEQRWTFDKAASRFVRRIGILPFVWRQAGPLGSLSRVVVRERKPAGPQKPSLLGSSPRGAVTLLVVDRDAHEYVLDVARGVSARTLRRTAEQVAGFCDLPLEEEAAPDP